MNRAQHIAVTTRDLKLFEALVNARWLSTSQIQRRFFRTASLNAVNKRMRRLASGDLLRCVRPGLTEQCYFRLTSKSAERLRDNIGSDLETIPNRFPKQIRHFEAINDVRLWFQDQFRDSLAGFWAEWEIKSLDRGPVVPDGVALVRVASGLRRLAIEVDLATENLQFLVKKMTTYEAMASTGELPFEAVVVTASGWPRTRSLISACYSAGMPTGMLRTWFGEHDQFLGNEALGFIDLSAVGDSNRLSRRPLESLLDDCHVGVSCGQDIAMGVTGDNNATCQPQASRGYVEAE